MELVGKTIVVTGASSGVGLELVKLLSETNRIIAIAKRSSLGDEMRAINPNIHAIQCDLSKSKQVEDIADLILKGYPAIDILVNNAAIQMTPEFLDDSFEVDSIGREIEINFTTICRLSYLLLPSMLKESRSLILNVNSGLAIAPKTSSAVYCATKAALDSFSISLGYQLDHTNIRVLQAFLPLVDTPMTEGRGRGKISPQLVAARIMSGLKKEKVVNDIGKVGILRFINRISPSLARKVMRRS